MESDNSDDLGSYLIEELKDELNDLESIDDYIKKNQESIAKSAESVRELQETVANLISHAGQRKTEIENRTFKLKEMKKEIEEISMDAIAYEEQELQKLLAEEAAHLKEKRSVTDEDILVTQIEAFREFLGLQVGINTEFVEYTFSNIDSQSTDTPFSIKLTVNNGVYKCMGCDPAISNIDELLNSLNNDHDLHAFMVSLRKEFVAVADKEN